METSPHSIDTLAKETEIILGASQCATFTKISKGFLINFDTFVTFYKWFHSKSYLYLNPRLSHIKITISLHHSILAMFSWGKKNKPSLKKTVCFHCQVTKIIPVHFRTKKHQDLYHLRSATRTAHLTG